MDKTKSCFLEIILKIIIQTDLHKIDQGIKIENVKINNIRDDGKHNYTKSRDYFKILRLRQ